MKVLQIYKDYYPPVQGGIEKHISLLANSLTRRGIDVEVLVSSTNLTLETETINGVKVTKAPQLGRLSSAPINIDLWSWIRRLGREADILHFHFPNPTGELSYLFSGLKQRVVVSYHSDIIRQRRLLKLYSPFQYRFLKKADAIIAGSPTYLETSNVLRHFRDKCRVIPYGIELESFKNTSRTTKTIESIREKYGPSIVLFVGRFRYYKGLHILIQAMRQVHGKLLLIGGGPLEPELMRQVEKEKLGDKIKFLGSLPDSEMKSYLHACDVFVLPSIFRSEAFGIVLLEAMACGKPVISTELGTGTSYVNIDNQTGIVIPPFDTHALSNSINYLIENPEIRKKYGNASFDRVRCFFSSDRMVDKISEIYNQCIHPATTHYFRPQFEHHAYEGAPVLNRPIKVMRIISRLNIGGPAIHVQQLVKGLDRKRFESILVTGKISRLEGDMGYIFDHIAQKPLIVPELQRDLNPFKDLRTFIKIFKLMIAERPDIVHTHAAKAGMTRLATFIYKKLFNKNVCVLHTFHGNVFEGYFSKAVSYLFILIERFFSSFTDVVVAISATQKQELFQKYRIAREKKVKIIGLGFNLEPFFQSRLHRGGFRREIGVDGNTILIGMVGRIVPIKNQKLFIRAVRILLTRHPDMDLKVAIVGDGSLRSELEAYCRELNLEQHVIFCGWIKDVTGVYADLDVLALTSLNEGTPVSIIEAMASGVPVIATGVGGVVDLLGKPSALNANGFKICERGIICRKNDAAGFSEGLAWMLDKKNQGEIQQILNHAQSYVREHYPVGRLINDIETLYLELYHSKCKH